MTDDDLAALKLAADQAVSRGDARTARELLQRATTLAPGRLELWLGLAACERALGDLGMAFQAVEAALGIDARCFPALLLKGSLLEAAGQTKAAAKIYGTACQLAPPPESLPEPTRRALDRAATIHTRYVDDLVEKLKTETGVSGTQLRSAEDRRVATFIEAIAGRRKIYPQEPVGFQYPGLPAIEFYERELFPWLSTVESYTSQIRDEAIAVWHEKSPDLVPYVNYPSGAPIDQWAELNGSLSWSAFHLLLDGAPVEENCRRCPTTMDALTHVDQPHVPGRSPTAMFSILSPHTRIPPHTGIANTRLVLHLPLIVPEECRFRVGGDIREWREGEAWIFDDTIEHEAWNDSQLPRAILICDVWSPFIPASERETIARLLGLLDDFNAATPEHAG